MTLSVVQGIQPVPHLSLHPHYSCLMAVVEECQNTDLWRINMKTLLSASVLMNHCCFWSLLQETTHNPRGSQAPLDHGKGMVVSSSEQIPVLSPGLAGVAICRGPMERPLHETLTFEHNWKLVGGSEGSEACSNRFIGLSLYFMCLGDLWNAALTNPSWNLLSLVLSYNVFLVRQHVTSTFKAEIRTLQL